MEGKGIEYLIWEQFLKRRRKWSESHLDDGDFVTIIGEKGTESIFSKQRNGDTQE